MEGKRDFIEEWLTGRTDRPLKDKVLDALREVLDPELGVNIVDLGLVYGVEVEDGHVRVTMTLTTPACPLHAYLSDMAKLTIEMYVPDVKSVEVRVVFDPPWAPEMMSEEARRLLGGAD